MKVRITTTIEPEDKAKLLELGNGELSAGITFLLSFYEVTQSGLVDRIQGQIQAAKQDLTPKAPLQAQSDATSQPTPTPQPPAPLASESTDAGAPRLTLVKTQTTMEEKIAIARRKLQASASYEDDAAPIKRLLCYLCGKTAGCVSENGPICIECANLREYQAKIDARSKPDSAPSVPTQIATRPACPTCTKRRFVVVDVAGVCRAEPCPTCKAACPDCENTGYVLTSTEAGYDALKPCSCGQYYAARGIRAINGGQFPGVFAPVLFGKLNTEISPEQKRAHQIAFDYYLAHGGQRAAREGLFFYGPPGTGKTLALCRALAQLAREGRKVRYLHFPAWLEARKTAFKDDYEGEAIEAPHELIDPDFLLIDEILLQGRGETPRRFSDWDRSQFELLIQSRWQANKATLYASNYSPDQIKEEISEASLSRISSTTKALLVTGDDYRRRAARKATR
jgi:DNA replication protein DnaC